VQFFKDIISICLLKVMVCLFPAGGTGFFPAGGLHQMSIEVLVENPENTPGYRDVVFDGSKFIAVGSGGRIDILDISGKKTTASVISPTDLNTIVTGDQMLIAAGNQGKILFRSGESQFSEIRSGTDKNINCITFFRDLWIAGADDGLLLFSKNGKTWTLNQTSFKGNVLSLDCNSSFCFGITDKGEIVKSSDGLNWEVKDYNKDYEGYNPHCIFRKIIVLQNRMMIIGIHDDRSPAVIYSSLGNVWTERLLSYKDENGRMGMLTEEPNDIAYDPDTDQFLVACNNGVIFTLPSCSHCNMLYKVSDENIRSIAKSNDSFMLTGDNFYSGFFK
jgi:hypothetical protein